MPHLPWPLQKPHLPKPRSPRHLLRIRQHAQNQTRPTRNQDRPQTIQAPHHLGPKRQHDPYHTTYPKTLLPKLHHRPLPKPIHKKRRRISRPMESFQIGWRTCIANLFKFLHRQKPTMPRLALLFFLLKDLRLQTIRKRQHPRRLPVLL